MQVGKTQNLSINNHRMIPITTHLYAAVAKKFFQIDVTIAENVLNNFVVARRSAILQFPV